MGSAGGSAASREARGGRIARGLDSAPMTCLQWTWIAGALVGASGLGGAAFETRAGVRAVEPAQGTIAEGGACRTMRRYFSPFYAGSGDDTARVRSPVGTPVP